MTYVMVSHGARDLAGMGLCVVGGEGAKANKRCRMTREVRDETGLRGGGGYKSEGSGGGRGATGGIGRTDEDGVTPESTANRTARQAVILTLV